MNMVQEIIRIVDKCLKSCLRKIKSTIQKPISRTKTMLYLGVYIPLIIAIFAVPLLVLQKNGNLEPPAALYALFLVSIGVGWETLICLRRMYTLEISWKWLILLLFVPGGIFVFYLYWVW